MPKSKPVMATQDDLEDLKQKLQEAIEAAKDSSNKSLQAAESKLRKDVKDLQDKCSQNAKLVETSSERVAADAKALLDAREDALKKHISQVDSKLQDECKRLSADIKALQEGYASKEVLAETIEGLCDQMEQNMASMKEELIEGTAKYAREAAEALVANRGELDDRINDLYRVADTLASKDEVTNQMQQAAADLEAADKIRDAESRVLEAEIKAALTQLKENLGEHTVNTNDSFGSMKSELSTDIARLKKESDIRHLEHQQEAVKFQAAVVEVENLATRRVDYVIKNVSKKLAVVSESAASHTSWFSPKFGCAGVIGLQIELQILRPPDDPNLNEEDKLLEGNGDCAIFLWACKGVNMVYRLHVGSLGSSLIEKSFNGRIPHGTQRICSVKDQVNKEDDTLTIGIEVLECIREVEHPIRTKPSDDAGAGDVEGLVISRRHVNHRMLDQIKQHADTIRSRMVRRVDWRLEQASLLRPNFPTGEALSSAPFSAAGAEGMQFVFYPSGYSTAADGCCSFFLYAPAGTTVRCSLIIGSRSWELNHTFEESSCSGRTNFCRFEDAIDSNTDTVLLGIQFMEAHQELQAPGAHPLAASGVWGRKGQQLNSTAISAVGGKVKSTRESGKPGTAFDERALLPSLWRRIQGGMRTLPDDDMHSFDELKRGATAPTPTGGYGSMRRIDSAPVVKRSASPGRTSPTSAEGTPQLPMLGARKGQRHPSQRVRA